MTGLFNITAVFFWPLLFPTLLQAADMEPTPFRTTNQSPLVVIQPLPAESSSVITPKERFSSALTFDLASNYSLTSTSSENVLLDGESYRWTLSSRYGLTDMVEVGIELPWVMHGGGFLDSFIIGWHDTFGLPQGGRDSAPKNRLRYSYANSGGQRILMKSSGSGIGDIVLTGGVKLYEEKTPALHDTLTLRATVKLPSGNSDNLRGSGAVGGTVSLCGALNRVTEWGSVGIFSSAGGMLSAKGKVLPEQQESSAVFGTLGLGWGPASWISFKLQLNANSRLYKSSSLEEIAKPAYMLVTGGVLKFPGDYQLDIGVSEDVAVGTASDVALHLGLSKLF